MSEQQKWDDILEAEGLGVIEVDGPYQGTNLKHIKGKWARLDAEINNLQSKSEVMTNSPQTARGFATRVAGNSDDAGGHMSGFGDDDYLTGNLRMVSEEYDDGLSDFETLGDDLWDSMALAVTASPKEAEIADRRRASVSGLDKWGRPQPLKVKRKPGESKAAWRQRTHERILGATAAPGEGVRIFTPPQPKPPHATADAGNGPLSIKETIRPDTLVATRDDGPIAMAPLVDTMYYPPGRGPYQRSLIAASNTDITG